MDKNKKGKKKPIIINKTQLPTKMGGKSYFIQNRECFYHLDSNYVGNIFLNYAESRLTYQKWEFTNSGTPGCYFIKNLQTGLYLSSNEIGDIMTSVDNSSSYVKWIVYSGSETDTYVIINYFNGLALSINKINLLILTKIEEAEFSDAKKSYLFYVYLNKPKKK